ncbi:MAG: hypothetical protein E7316_02295 [Clostridiales bacterium]|nr:hypothetical protein [Clostridiales bacterium]
MFDFMERIFLMADGGGGDGAGAASSDGGGGFAGVTGQDAAGQDGRGADASAQGDDTQQPTVPDAKARKAAFQKLIREEYPEEFKEHNQKIIQNRLKGAKVAEERLANLEPALKLLQRQYGTEDPAALAAAITGDTRWYEAEAQRRGMDTQTFMLLDQKEQALQAMRQQQAEQQERQEQAKMVMKWRGEEAALREIYPNFDLNAEMEENKEFFNLLKNGISVRHAYETLHMDEIMGQTVAGAVQRTAQRTMDTIRANGMRPQENGAGKTPAKPVKLTVSQLTPQQMRDIERRLARGEVITPDKLG